MSTILIWIDNLLYIIHFVTILILILEISIITPSRGEKNLGRSYFFLVTGAIMYSF